jgi:hypothetical protein
MKSYLCQTKNKSDASGEAGDFNPYIPRNGSSMLFCFSLACGPREYLPSSRDGDVDTV